MKKTILKVALVSTMILGLSGCVESDVTKVEKVVSTFTSTIIEGSLSASDSSAFIINYTGEDFSLSAITEGFSTSLNEIVVDKYTQNSSVISEVTINENIATVKIEVLGYPIGESFLTSLFESLGESIKLSFNGATQEEIDAAFDKIYTDNIMALEKNYSGTAIITLVKVNNEWKIDYTANATQSEHYMELLTSGLWSFTTTE